MKNFKDWVQETKGVDLTELATDSAQATFARPVGGTQKRMDVKPVTMEVNKKKKKKSDARDMDKDFHDLDVQ